MANFFYGEPEKAVPCLCILLASIVLFATGSLVWGLSFLVVSLAIWHSFSPKLVINDLGLGPITLRCPGKERQIWLTFDDGPSENTLEILEFLNEYQFPATFFFVGSRLKEFEHIERLEQLLNEGQHRVANHSFSHPNFLSLTEEQTREELELTQAALEEHFPGSVIRAFRPPFGYRNRTTLKVASELGLEVVGWSLNSLDFLKNDKKKVIQRVHSKSRAGEILLFHDTGPESQKTLACLAPLLEYWTSKNLEGYIPD